MKAGISYSFRDVNVILDSKTEYLKKSVSKVDRSGVARADQGLKWALSKNRLKNKVIFKTN